MREETSANGKTTFNIPGVIYWLNCSMGLTSDDSAASTSVERLAHGFDNHNEHSLDKGNSLQQLSMSRNASDSFFAHNGDLCNECSCDDFASANFKCASTSKSVETGLRTPVSFFS